eukprot:CAMPEP_0178898556 /NCGR_PEP_ID=MMETSP0786-20121207/2403_1 /TAXON_ID=186022 /ORGANISM="Thalassionema frauenfeldii, Strain CCMP 1798" /LENGTH=327 /DNA_ID=CAMNT_0020569301 /DNA_START=88 /DNA_END=1068 /DNA_ORIENTATION=+
MEDPFSCFSSDSDDCSRDEFIGHEHEQGKRLKEAANIKLQITSKAGSTDYTPIESSGYEIYSCSNQDGYITGQFGIRAKRKYETGDLIMSESPAMRINTAFVASTREEAVEKYENKLQDVFDNLSPLTAQSIMDLSSCKETDEVKTPMGIFQTNSFSLEQNTGYGGLFITVARMNHSCNPNVNHHWRPDVHRMNCYAARDIAINEELCTNYGPTNLTNFSSTSERREYLEKKYAFRCACEMCMCGNDYGGDDRMLEIRDLLENISCFTNEPHKLKGDVDKCLQLMKQQGIKNGKNVATVLHHGYLASMMSQENDMARSYLQKELKCV